MKEFGLFHNRSFTVDACVNNVFTLTCNVASYKRVLIDNKIIKESHCQSCPFIHCLLYISPFTSLTVGTCHLFGIVHFLFRGRCLHGEYKLFIFARFKDRNMFLLR